jgi:hypothetical protein
VTTVAGTFGLLFGFFGINTVEIRPDRSIFDHRYAAIYLVIAGLIAAAGILYLVLRALERRQTTRDRQWLGHLPTRPAKPADQPPQPPAEPAEPGAAASAIEPAGTDAHPINLEDRGQAEPGRDPRTAEPTQNPGRMVETARLSRRSMGRRSGQGQTLRPITRSSPVDLSRRDPPHRIRRAARSPPSALPVLFQACRENLPVEECRSAARHAPVIRRPGSVSGLLIPPAPPEFSAR